MIYSDERGAMLAEAGEDGTLVIADMGQNRILGGTITGQFLRGFFIVPGSKLAHLNQPRWAKVVNPNEIIVCDHFHNCVLHVKWSQSRQTAG